jgi:hypothetical protein
MYKSIPFLASLFFLMSCEKEETLKNSFNEGFLQLSIHKLITYSIDPNSKYLVVFESGLGDDHSVWQTKKVEDISTKMDVVQAE